MTGMGNNSSVVFTAFKKKILVLSPAFPASHRLGLYGLLELACPKVFH